ncbi:ABC transporter substrate-binding protein [uncultured Alsobacter sp.]|uniref:ABC transporter substrate-binding protein n=1 Tax=uncultured Alsobacter sp. TaxID=1748258 RepID=UPI0025EA0A19|nr:ABC transporter substrate-binding protein [uncultured Alsobacter sp.]
MDRRSFLRIGLSAPLATGIAGAARAQSALPEIVFLGLATQEADQPQLGAFLGGMKEQGLVDGQTYRLVEFHARGDAGAAQRFIAEMVARKIAVFLSPGPAVARLLVRSTTLPVVSVGLPSVPGDLFATVARPGGNLTGFSWFGQELSAKRIELVREVLPGLSSIGILHTVTDPVYRDWGIQTETSAREQGLRPTRLGLTSSNPDEIVRLMSDYAAQGGQAVFVVYDFLTRSTQDTIIALGDKLSLAVISEVRSFVEAGALMSYGADTLDLFRRSAGYVARILKGEAPGNLPVQFPTKVEFLLNLRTARRLGIPLKETLIARADDIVD